MEKPTSPPPRITLRHMGAELIRYLNFEKGILLVLKELSRRPGSFLRDYLYLNRVGFTTPIGFLVISATLATLITVNLPLYLIPGGEFVEATQTGKSGESGLIIMEVMMNYYNIVLIFIVPFFAIFSFLFFRKSGLNFPENLAVNAYISGYQNFIYVALVPFLFFGSWVYFTYFIISLGYQIVAYKHLFQVSWRKAVWKGSMVVSLAYLLYMIVVGFIIGIAALYLSSPK